MTSLADKAILSGADNRPPMLEKDTYDSWKSIMELYMLNRQHGRMILESLENRLPPVVYALVSTHKVAKELWERIQMLMQRTSLTKQERECKLYDEFDKFTYKKGESLRDFYLSCKPSNEQVTLSTTSAVIPTTSISTTSLIIPVFLVWITISFFTVCITSSIINTSEETDAIVIRDSEETLMFEDESRSKMLQKQKYLMMSEKKVNTKPIDYAALTQLSNDFETHFVPQTELLAKQAFWSQNFRNSKEPHLSSSTTIVKVPKELPEASMVNSSLKKLKFHLA
nr:hypothetical protein [Tanacetum cinerariifolium]